MERRPRENIVLIAWMVFSVVPKELLKYGKCGIYLWAFSSW